MRNYTLTRIWGIPVRINISLLIFIPILAWLIGSGEQIDVYSELVGGLLSREVDVPRSGSVTWTVGFAAAAGLFGSVLLHELGHSWAGLRYGIETESITLWLLSGIAGLEEIPKEWRKELWIALAGPAASVGVGVVCYAVAVSLPSGTPVLVFLFGWLAVANLMLTVFNLLPEFPMDGGRVLRALLARSRPHMEATQIAARIGVYFGVVFAVVGVLSFSPILVLLALFIYGAAKSESSVSMLEGYLEGVSVRDVMTGAGGSGSTLESSTPLSDLAERMFMDRRTSYAVSEDGRVVGIVSLDDVGRVTDDEMSSGTVGDVLTPSVSPLRRPPSRL